MRSSFTVDINAKNSVSKDAIMAELLSKLSVGLKRLDLSVISQYGEDGIKTISLPADLSNNEVAKVCDKVANEIGIQLEINPYEGYYAFVCLGSEIIGILLKQLDVCQQAMQDFAFNNCN